VIGNALAGGKRDTPPSLVKLAVWDREMVRLRAWWNPLPMGIVIPWTITDVRTRKYTTGVMTLLMHGSARIFRLSRGTCERRCVLVSLSGNCSSAT
jgi:hypothetical protein